MPLSRLNPSVPPAAREARTPDAREGSCAASRGERSRAGTGGARCGRLAEVAVSGQPRDRRAPHRRARGRACEAPPGLRGSARGPRPDPDGDGRAGNREDAPRGGLPRGARTTAGASVPRARRCSERLAGAEAYLPVLEALDGLLHQSSWSSVPSLIKTVAPTWACAGGARGIQPGVCRARARGRARRVAGADEARARRAPPGSVAAAPVRPVPRRPALGGRLYDRRAELSGRPLRPDAAAVLDDLPARGHDARAASVPRHSRRAARARRGRRNPARLPRAARRRTLSGRDVSAPLPRFACRADSRENRRQPALHGRRRPLPARFGQHRRTRRGVGAGTGPRPTRSANCRPRSAA